MAVTDLPAQLVAALSDRYTVERELGQGGMATVYLAYDIKHERKVAVKVLRPELASVLGAERFLNEIKVTARLHHPHILPLHDSGDADSFLYYVMPYVEGESLRDKLARDGQLPMSEAVNVLREMADALAYAHERGIVHRDIKPDNVLLSGRHALLADLGIAKAVTDTTPYSQLTTAGVILGTPDYMAPEQAAADRHIDHRVDIYAFGVMAFELLAGRPPFHGRSPQEVLAAHVMETPEPITVHRAEIPARLNRLVMRCLEKKPADRWQSAEDIVRELEALGRTDQTVATREPPNTTQEPPKRTVHVGGRGKRLAPTVLIVTVGLAAGVWALTTFTGDVQARRIAVLPFENLSGADEEYFSEGITQDVNTQIAKIGDFVVIAHGSAQRAQNSGQGYREMAEQLGVDYLVDGSVSRAGDRVRITAALVDPETNEQLWANDYDRELSVAHIFTIRSEIAQQVANALDVTLSPTQEAELSARPTDNLQAYQEYLRGVFFWEKRTIEAFDSAVVHFERAIALDSEFALAYAGLADIHLVRPWFSVQYSNREGLELSEEAARRAIALDPTLGQPHATLGLAREWQFEWGPAEVEFRRSIELDPEYAPARHWYALLLGRLGRHEEARVEIRRSLELDPLSPIINQDVGYVLLLAGESEAGIRQYQRTLELDPDFSTTRLALARRFLEAGRFDEGRDALGQWAEDVGQDPSLVSALADLAASYAESGERPVIPAAVDLESTFPPYIIAPLYMVLGHDEAALDYLERGYDQSAFGVLNGLTLPTYDRIRSDPRFADLARKTGLAR